MIIRQETNKDYSEIYNLIKTAFETAEVKDGDEQDFAVQLRESENYIPELALIVEKEGKLIGHIMFTKLNIDTPNGYFEALLLAPIAILLEYRNQGVGSLLIREGLKLAKDMNYSAVFLCGDPAYYNRLGFKETSEFGVKNGCSIPDQYVMAYELKEGVLRSINGTANFC